MWVRKRPWRGRLATRGRRRRRGWPTPDCVQRPWFTPRRLASGGRRRCGRAGRCSRTGPTAPPARQRNGTRGAWSASGWWSAAGARVRHKTRNDRRSAATVASRTRWRRTRATRHRRRMPPHRRTWRSAGDLASVRRASPCTQQTGCPWTCRKSGRSAPRTGPLPRYLATVSSAVRRWLQLRFDFNSTTIRRPIDCLSKRD